LSYEEGIYKCELTHSIMLYV